MSGSWCCTPAPIRVSTSSTPGSGSTRLNLGLLTVWHNDDRVDTSNAAVRNGRVVVYRIASNLISHPSLDYIDDGFGILTADAVLDLVRADEPHDLTSLYSALAGRSQLQAYEVDERLHDIGSRTGLTELERRLTSELQRWP